MPSLMVLKLQLSDSSSVVVHPEDFDHADEKHEVAIIGPQQLEVESLESDAKPEPEVRADDCTCSNASRLILSEPSH